MRQEKISLNYRWLAYRGREPKPRQSMGMSEMLLGNEKNSWKIRIAGHVRGGRLVTAGSPEELAGHPESHTGRFLRNLLPGTSEGLVY